MVRILHFHCRGHGFNPWRSNQDPTNCEAPQRIKKWLQTVLVSNNIFFLNPATFVIAGKVKMIQMVINRRYQNIIEDIMIQ